jgi:hypothetical protein
VGSATENAWFVKRHAYQEEADDMKNQRPHDANCRECDMAEFTGISYEAAHAQVESDVQRRGPQAMSEPIMQFFAFEHLQEPLQAVSRSFAELARALVTTLPRNPERTVALRKLLEAKDCAVRAVLFQGEPR